ncbi:DUF6090 family protein [Muriicola sp. Z0-33]|uniref:DUF6090 family protein n=1 Tax=Muriicola sp. Z0-33 TaxID=2816957 RepID=UPI0022384C67|nr:DUF6090 family protein [Muriicola sp. Z0-33]MCW5516038.1 hypothetical protein [Muriicola sp. Z0-33]
MIKFFRRIRQQLISENRISKYLLYALGEIILVVIGILIALQINNWNELSKQNETGIEYLKRIHSDLEKDITYLNNKELSAKEIQFSFEMYIKNIYKQQLNTEDFKKLTGSVFWEAENLILEDRTYNEITNSGKFSYIKNAALRDKIMDYYLRYNAIDEHISEMNQTGINMFQDSYKKFIKFYPILESLFDTEAMKKNTHWKFINDPDSQEFRDLESAAVFYYYKHSVFEKYFLELKFKGGELIELIENEISNGNKSSYIQ